MRLRYEPYAGLIVVNGWLQCPFGVERVRLAVDTGATRTVLDRAVLDALLLPTPPGAEKVPLMTGAGKLDAACLLLPRIEALGKACVGFRVLTCELPIDTGLDGFLGLDFFRDTRLTVDFRDRYITVE